MEAAPIYLDYNATTALHPEVWAQMTRVAEMGLPLNPSSLHASGRRAKALLAQIRTQVATACGMLPQEVIFTSGGTEALNLLIRGLLPPTRGTILYGAADHKAVTATVRSLETLGYRTRAIAPDRSGLLSVERIAEALSPDVVLMVFGGANSETGVIQDLRALGELAAWHRIPLVIDAVGLLGKEPISWFPGVTGMALSAHKAHGPTGAGVALLRKAAHLQPLHTGGGQEHGRRSGTEALLAWAGAACAIELVQGDLPEAATRMRALRDRLEQKLLALDVPVEIIGAESPRLCNTTCVAFPGHEGEVLVIELDRAGICASHGTACSAGAHELSPALLSMGLPPAVVRSAIRFSVGRGTTEADIDEAIRRLERVLVGAPAQHSMSSV